MYSNAVLNVFKNPKNSGRISKPDGIADCFNYDETAHVEFSLRIESGIITNCQFRAQANPYIIAVCSTITNMVKGKMCSMVFLDPYSIQEQLGDHSDVDIMFCIDCLKMALNDYKEKLIKENKGKKSEEIDEAAELDEISEDTTEQTLVEEFEKEVEIKEVPSVVDNEDDDDDDILDDDDFDFIDFLDDKE